MCVFVWEVGEGGLSAPPLEFFILYFLKFVLIFGCAGSSLLHAGDSGGDVWASHCDGFFLGSMGSWAQDQ